MGRKLHSIHVINSDIEKVSLCLANCQMTNINKSESTLAKVKKLNKITDEFKKETADFYILQTGNVINIYSAYFENDFNIKELRQWFAGENSFVFFLDYSDDSLCKIDLFKKYKLLTPLILKKDADIIIQQSLFKFDEIHSIFQISESDLDIEFNSLEEYLQHFSSLFKIPFNLSLSDVADNPKAECLSFFI